MDACYAKSHATGADIEATARSSSAMSKPQPPPTAAPAPGSGTFKSQGRAQDKPSTTRTSSSASSRDTSLLCSRCARTGHTEKACFAQTHGNGANWCLRCGREGHEVESCYAKSRHSGSTIASTTNHSSSKPHGAPSSGNVRDTAPSASAGGTVCFRCGRKGHLATTCFAKTHASGAHL